MFSAFLSLSGCSLRRLLRPSLEAEDKPSFQTLPARNDDFAIYGRENLDTTLSGLENEVSQKRKVEYYSCSLTIGANAVFKNNYAFGKGMAGGSGGAVFISYSVLMGTGRCTFKSNTAGVGGGLCCTASKVYLNNPTFQSNTAYKYGGGLYFQGVFYDDPETLPYSTEHVYNQIDGIYLGNVAHEIGGAVAFSNAGESSYFENTKFTNNKADLNGGAVYAINAPLQFYDSKFFQNTVGEDYVSEDKRNTGMDKSTTWASSHFRARGGGAICFVSDTLAEGYPRDGVVDQKSNRRLYTQNCCFSGNSAIRGISFGSGSGHEVLLDGYAYWVSYYDTIPGLSQETTTDKPYNNLISFSNSDKSETTDPNPYVWFYSLNKEATESCTYTPSNLPTEYSISRPASKPDSNGTSSIPQPTTFVYAATPITQLPYKTTSSYSKYSTASFSKYSSPTRRTIHATFAQTPYETPYTTPLTTPYTTPHTTPLITPEETPHTTPLTTPEETPFRTPMSSALIKATPFTTPAISPESTPATTPASTPEITPATTPLETPFRTFSPSISQSPIIHTIPSYDPNAATTMTITYSWSFINTVISTLTSYYSNGELIITSAPIETSYKVEVPTSVTTNMALAADPAPDEKDNNMMIIIGAAIGVFILLIIIAVLIYLLIKKKRNEETSSAVELAEETILNLPDTDTAIVSKDNPLWTTSVIGESDDPFRNDFEEITDVGFFHKEF